MNTHNICFLWRTEENYHVPTLSLLLLSHTCHKLCTEICEIRQIFKGDVIKFCEIFIKIILELPKIVKSLYLNARNLGLTQQSVIYVYFFIKCVVTWSKNSVRFEKSSGNWLPDGPNSVRFYLTV